VLIYVADPMCSWCYGFGPELQAVLDRFPDQPLQLVMGGLRAYNTRVMDADMRNTLAHHWDEVQRASGQPFDRALLARADFIYDTEPACRAVVTVRNTDPRLAWPLFHAVQRAFYAQARDVTRAEVLAEVYAEVRSEDGDPASRTVDEFAKALASDAMKESVRIDFRRAHEWEVQGFPALFAERDAHYALLAPGYVKAAALIERAQAFFSGADQSP
jgi:putative protein-disulfide isomerase